MATQQDYSESARTLTGMFRNRDAAERAWYSLHERGYGKEDVDLLMSEDTRSRHFGEGTVETELGNKAMEGAGTGSAIGGTLGAIAGAVAAIGTTLVVPGLGIVLAGPIAAALAGAGAGGLAGGLIGALVGRGIPEEHAKRYEDDIRNGGIVISVKPKSFEDADYLKNSWKSGNAEYVDY
jgi:hypothetical protein